MGYHQGDHSNSLGLGFELELELGLSLKPHHDGLIVGVAWGPALSTGHLLRILIPLEEPPHLTADSCLLLDLPEDFQHFPNQPQSHHLWIRCSLFAFDCIRTAAASEKSRSGRPSNSPASLLCWSAKSCNCPCSCPSSPKRIRALRLLKGISSSSS